MTPQERTIRAEAALSRTLEAQRRSPLTWRHRLAFSLVPSLSAIFQENNFLRERNADLHAQNESLRTAKPMQAEQWREVERITREHTELVEQQGKVIVYLRNKDPQMFENKCFVGLTFSELIIALLGGGNKNEQ
jgi:hypothetical protein